MVDRDALSSRQPSRLINAGRAPRRRPQAPRHRKWGAAFVGLLLASGAGVYTYRQFIHPVPDAEDTAPDAARVAAPGPGFDQIASLREIPEPIGAPVAVAPASRPEPPAQRELAGQASLPRSSDTALHVARPGAVAVSSGTPPSPRPQQPAAEIAGKLPGSPLPDADPALLEATVPDSGELSLAPSMELGAKVEEAADTASLLPPVSREEDPAQESYARAEPVSDIGVQAGGITGHHVEPSPLAKIAEAEPSTLEVVSGDDIQVASEAQIAIGDSAAGPPEDTAGELPGAQVASEAQFAIADRPAGVLEDTAGELPGAIREIEPSAALTVATGEEAADEPPERAPLLAERPTDEETIIAAKPAKDEPAFIAAKPAEDKPAFIPANPIPAPPASAAMTEGASASAEFVQRFPMVVLNGTPLGAITLREFAGGQRLIHLGALLSLFRSKMDPAEFERLISAGTADQFVSLEVLRRAGLEAQYNARRGRLTIGSHSGDPDE